MSMVKNKNIGQPQQSQFSFARIALLGTILLLVFFALWLMASRDRSSPNELARRATESTQEGNRPSATVLPSPSPNVTNSSAIAARSQSGVSTATGWVDKEIMLRQLKIWIRKREGYEAQIVSSQDILNLKGSPASLNVIVTSLANGGLTVEKLKAGLDEAAAKEQTLREQLGKAKQAEDIAGVNRLVAELVESRTAFVTNNGVSSYKLSLLKELPPVLAFWPGLPFETVREASAQNLAETKLDGGVVLHGLVHFTSATALMRFDNSAGETVYIDPFRMTEVSQNMLNLLSQGAMQRDDAGRDSRIAAQWTDYLQP